MWLKWPCWAESSQRGASPVCGWDLDIFLASIEWDDEELDRWTYEVSTNCPLSYIDGWRGHFICSFQRKLHSFMAGNDTLNRNSPPKNCRHSASVSMSGGYACNGYHVYSTRRRSPARSSVSAVLLLATEWMPNRSSKAHSTWSHCRFLQAPNNSRMVPW